MQEDEMSKLSVPELRYREAVYFYKQFVAHSGPPQDSYFLMVSYFDAFLFALTSVEEMLDVSNKKALHNIDAFAFIKTLRDVTVHHSVLAAPQPGAKFIRPFNRHVKDLVGGQSSSSRLAISYDQFRNIFNMLELERPFEKVKYERARKYLAQLEAYPQPVFLSQVLDAALEGVRSFIAGNLAGLSVFSSPNPPP